MEDYSTLASLEASAIARWLSFMILEKEYFIDETFVMNIDITKEVKRGF